MTLRFLGTRGEIPIRSRRHWRHTATAVESAHRRVVVDLGRDWIGMTGRIKPDAIVLTHAHPDHVGGLRHGSPCRVYATAATWRSIGGWALRDRAVVRPWTPFEVFGIRWQAVPVAHSINAPAVGYRIAAGRRAIFYVPDVAALLQPRRALAGVDLYVGDGAAITRSILRIRDRALIGHASIATQLDWCRDHGIRHAVFTHCGSAIVRFNHREARRRVAALGRERGVNADVASDGDAIHVSDGNLRRSRRRGTSQRPHS